MSLELEDAAVKKYFREVAWDSSWGEVDTLVAWPNQPFNTPVDHFYCVFSIVDRGWVRMSLGRDFMKRRLASMQIDIYSPQDTGTRQAKIMTDLWEILYSMLEIPLADGETVVFGDPSARVLDPNVIRATNLEDNWDRYLFEAPYHRDYRVTK